MIGAVPSIILTLSESSPAISVVQPSRQSQHLRSLLSRDAFSPPSAAPILTPGRSAHPPRDREIVDPAHPAPPS